MKIREGFLLQEIAGTWVVVPVGTNAVNFNKMLKLNHSAAFLWSILKTGAEKEDLVAAVLSEYCIDEETAQADVEEIIAVFDQKGLLAQ